MRPHRALTLPETRSKNNLSIVALEEVHCHEEALEAGSSESLAGFFDVGRVEIVPQTSVDDRERSVESLEVLELGFQANLSAVEVLEGKTEGEDLLS